MLLLFWSFAGHAQHWPGWLRWAGSRAHCPFAKPTVPVPVCLQLFSAEMVMKFVPRYSLVLELRENGSCRRSFHDPHGVVAAYVSEAHEHNGHLFLGSFRSPYLCKLDLSQV